MSHIEQIQRQRPDVAREIRLLLDIAAAIAAEAVRRAAERSAADLDASEYRSHPFRGFPARTT